MGRRSAEEMEKNVALDSVATALARKLLPGAKQAPYLGDVVT